MLLVAVIALLLFGKDLPNVAREWGKAFNEFRRHLNGIESELNDAIYAEPERPKLQYHPEFHEARPAARGDRRPRPTATSAQRRRQRRRRGRRPTTLPADSTAAPTEPSTRGRRRGTRCRSAAGVHSPASAGAAASRLHARRTLGRSTSPRARRPPVVPPPRRKILANLRLHILSTISIVQNIEVRRQHRHVSLVRRAPTHRSTQPMRPTSPTHKRGIDRVERGLPSQRCGSLSPAASARLSGALARRSVDRSIRPAASRRPQLAAIAASAAELACRIRR